LTIDGVAGVVALIEAMHYNIGSVPGTRHECCWHGFAWGEAAFIFHPQSYRANTSRNRRCAGGRRKLVKIPTQAQEDVGDPVRGCATVRLRP
jgi:hypothetical protein